MSAGGGFIAIWSDVQAEQETDYLHWLTREHTQERLAVPGFQAVRVFRARARETRRYFILYRLDGPEIVSSAAYLARLNEPTPWSRRIMPTLGNFARGGGRRLMRHGSGSGALAAPVVLAAAALVEVERRMPDLAAMDRIAAVELLAVDRAASEIGTDEKAIRSGDRSFDALLMVEALDEAALKAALVALDAGGPGQDGTLVYDQIFSLERGDAA